jgi:crotonobetainyl-CoA:carnitine CoA-transferase CaiB-like acyl-CoA transferase
VKPLAGTRIVDLSRYAPGPYASLVCAALGAEVVKVEAPTSGDPLRHMDARAFERLNQGKKSVVLDLKTEDGAAKLRRLLASARVVIESFRPGVMARLGLEYASLRSVAPEIVYVSISGYGQSGPSAMRAGHDVNYMASAGALEGLARPLPVQVADFAAGGLFAVVAILAALMEGSGRFIDLSMHEGVLSLSRLSDGDAADRLSGRYPNYTVYTTKDGGALSVGALEPKFWEAFCAVVERPDWVAHRADPALRAPVAALIKTRTRDAWEELFREADACVEVVRTAREAFAQPQATHRGQTTDDFQLPFGLSRTALAKAPALGEHTEEIFG